MKLGLTFFLLAVSLVLTKSKIIYTHIHSDENTYVACPEYIGHSYKYSHSSWTASIPGADWIWGPHNSGQAMSCRFQRNFDKTHAYHNAYLDVAADDAFSVFVNNHDAYCTCSSECWLNANKERCYINNLVIWGTNKLVFRVSNKGGPAGLIYTLCLMHLT